MDGASLLNRPLVGAALLLTALTVMMTWPQAIHLGTQVAVHPDPRLSIWRLAWFAHALKDHVRPFFDGNIFYPNPGAFAYSDATLLEGLLAAPWLWAHVNAVAVYNVLLLTGMISSGLGTFVLVRYLTGNSDAALVSATVFTLVPYRIEHFMHLELQWTVWMPLAMWAVHRAFDRPSIRAGLLPGLLVSLQLLSCVYYGVFLGIMLAALALLLATTRPNRAVAGLRVLAIGSLIPLLVAAVYAQPYLANAKMLGPRGQWEIALFSAQPGSYLSAPRENWLWGWTAWEFTGNELHLFPGVVAVALAAVALAIRPGRLIWIYTALVALAVELSLGLNGTLYSWLYFHLPALNGLRAPARFSILACSSLAVLSGFGFASLQTSLAALHARSGEASENTSGAASAMQLARGTRLRRPLLIATLVAIGLESGSAPMRLEALSTEMPDGYKFLRARYPSVIIELPFEDWDLAPDFMYWSTYHWNSLVNGYSGYQPPSYVETQKRMKTFPDEASLDRLKQLNVRYIVIHEYFFSRAEFVGLMTVIARHSDLTRVGRFRGFFGSMQILELKP